MAAYRRTDGFFLLREVSPSRSIVLIPHVHFQAVRNCQENGGGGGAGAGGSIWPNNRVSAGTIGTGSLFDAFNNTSNSGPFGGGGGGGGGGPNVNQDQWSLGLIPSHQQIFGSLAQQ